MKRHDNRCRRAFGIVIITGLLLMQVSCGSADRNDDAIDRHQRLAGELRNNKLYHAAIEEYREILRDETLDDNKRANINYLIARIYFDNLELYEEAAAHYVRARSLNPEASFAAEASRKLVASLEKMGHMLDARRRLAEVVDIDSPPSDSGDVAVAQVGGVPIWLSEIEQQIQMLPPQIQQQFVTRQAKVEFVHNYVATELLYHAAIREGYDNDPEIKRQARLVNKKLLVDKYVVDKVMPQVRIDSTDVRNYYLAHREDRYRNAPYDSVQAAVFLDYQNEKAEATFSDYISQLARVEKVEFLDHNVK